MYPTIYHLFKDLFGLELPFLKLVNSFGFFVVVAFVAAAYFLGREIERKTKMGVMSPVIRNVTRGAKPGLWAYISSGLIGFVIGYKFIHAFMHPEALSNPPAFLFSMQGSIIPGLLMGGLFVWMRHREYQKEVKEFPTPTEVPYKISAREHANSLAVQAAFWGFLGAKLFFIFEDPKYIVRFFTEFSVDSILSGLTIYGGLILGTFGVLRYFKKNGMPVLAGADATAPGFILAYGLGRIGCHVAGDGDWGVANTAPKPDWLSWLPDWLWSYDYPNNVNGAGVPLPEGSTIFEGYGTHLVPSVWPTPLYELTMGVIMFLILWSLRKRLKPYGAIFFLTLGLNGVERWFIEKVRVNEKIGDFTQAEYISLALIVICIAGLIYVYKKGERPAELAANG